jgi:hypothetical protein
MKKERQLKKEKHIEKGKTRKRRGRPISASPKGSVG